MFFSAVRGRTTQAERASEFERLLRNSHRAAYGLAYRLTGNAVDAEDLVQEAFVRAYRFFDNYDRGLPFNSWLYRIISNTHIDLIRRKGRLKTTSLDTSGSDGLTTWEIADQDAPPDRELMQNSLDDRIQSALGLMNPEFRTAVLLADVEGLAYEEVAEIMRTSVGTVRSRIHRGRKQLRDSLMRMAPGAYRQFADSEVSDEL